MEIQERKQRLADLQQLAVHQPGLPWWVMDFLRILADVVTDLDDIGSLCEQLEETNVEQQKALNGLRDKYSEVLYKLKSGD